MNKADDRTNTVEDAAIDRLIDGDLDDASRRDLLLRLDQEPDGWRRCALAFLEDQAWRAAIGGAIPKSAVPIPLPAAPARKAPAASLRWAVAASLMAATFAAGFAVGGGTGGRAPVADGRPIAPAVTRLDDRVREVGSIVLRDGTEGESAPHRVPILAGPGLDDRWVRDQPPSVPDYVRAQWQRRGYQVEERRRLVSVVLDDGRRVSIPVDEIAVEYVGQQTF